MLFIDVAGSLRITRELGDAQAYRVLKTLSEAVRRAESNTGRMVRALGDGFLLAFDSVDEAIAHAATAQRAVEECAPAGVNIKVRCGIHYGDVVEADGDLFGVSVYLASRVCGNAHGGEILLTQAAREQSCARPSDFNDFGPTLLPGFEDPVRIYEHPWH